MTPDAESPLLDACSGIRLALSHELLYFLWAYPNRANMVPASGRLDMVAIAP